jgi:hypothetical protein
LGLFQHVVASVDHDIVFIAEDCRDPVRDPLLHKIDLNFLDVDFLVKFRWELGVLETLLVDAERHDCGGSSCG